MKDTMLDGIRWLIVWAVSFFIVVFTFYELREYFYERWNGVRNQRLMRYMGQCCAEFRHSIGAKQEDVARDTGYSVETVSGFECGRNNNASILLWYMSRGMVIRFAGVKKNDD